MVAFDTGNLNDDEQLILHLRPHWWYFAPQATILLAVIALGVVSLLFGLPQVALLVVAAAIVAVLIWFLIRYVAWTTTTFTITSDRLINRSGVLQRQGIEIPLERVNTVFFRQTIFERLLGFGDLVIESAGEQGSQMVDNIRRPLHVQNEIYKQMEANENRKFDRVGRNVGGPAPASIPEQIEKLAQLRQQGILTDHEFET
ncbi:MAG: PH domain-containing protein, partial [Actinomycetota bacterium]